MLDSVRGLAPDQLDHPLVAQAVDHGIADDLLDAAAQARRGFRLVVPDRPEHREHQLGVDLTDRNVVNLRTAIELGPDAVLVLAEPAGCKIWIFGRPASAVT